MVMRSIIFCVVVFFSAGIHAAPPLDYATAFANGSQSIPSGVRTKVIWNGPIINESDAILELPNKTDWLFKKDVGNGIDATGYWPLHANVTWDATSGQYWPKHRRIIRIMQLVDFGPVIGIHPTALVTGDVIYDPEVPGVQNQQVYVQARFTPPAPGKENRVWVEVYQDSGYTIPLKYLGFESPFFSLLRAQGQ